MFPCILNGKEAEHAVIQAKEEAGEIDYIAADYLRAKLLAGLPEDRLEESFLGIVKPLKSIKAVVDTLHSKNIQCIVITVGPIQVARIVAKIWGFDACYGSDYETVDGVFTGEIISYIYAESKIECLLDFCEKNAILPEECIAVGDGSTDIPLFDYCGKSIALNASPKVKKQATVSVVTDDLADIVEYIV
jgi:phosphoserine phosphatase